MKTINISGQRFGKLIAREEAKKCVNGRTRWLCECDCGKLKIIHTSSLRRSLTNSCGCDRREKFKKMITKHNMSYSRIYRIWFDMIKRCYKNYANENEKNNYQMRNIDICEEWKNSFESFFSGHERRV